MIWPGSPITMCTSTWPGVLLSSGTMVFGGCQWKLPSAAGFAHVYFTPAPS